jgi:vacuolar-type H+-ATPase subunit I/STV1
MKIRCLLLTGSVAILQYTASQIHGSAVLVGAHRLREDNGTPPQTYYIDQEGQLQTVEGTERRKAEAAEAKQRKDKDEKLSKAKTDFKAQIEKFSRSLAREDFESALQMKTDLMENEGVTKEELDKTKIATRALYQKGFQFAEVARNDYAAEQLEELEIAEKNFNANIDNKDLLESFLNTAASVKKNLQSKYQDQWTEPAATAEAGPKEDSGDE